MLKKTTFSLTLSQKSPAILSFPNLVNAFNNILIEVSVETLVENHRRTLLFTYKIQIPDSLAPYIHWQEKKSYVNAFVDELWLDTCLECFIGKRGNEQYIEINASPQGQNQGAYAVYYFEGYRYPQPPKALTIVSSSDEKKENSAKITWHADPAVTQKNLDYQKSFSFSLAQLPSSLCEFDLLHPCVILFVELDGIKKELFYACHHANPADFHDQRFWQTGDIIIT